MMLRKSTITLKWIIEKQVKSQEAEEPLGIFKVDEFIFYGVNDYRKGVNCEEYIRLMQHENISNVFRLSRQ